MQMAMVFVMSLRLMDVLMAQHVIMTTQQLMMMAHVHMLLVDMTVMTTV